jgi:hypothetical protein
VKLTIHLQIANNHNKLVKLYASVPFSVRYPIEYTDLVCTSQGTHLHCRDQPGHRPRHEGVWGVGMRLRALQRLMGSLRNRPKEQREMSGQCLAPPGDWPHSDT